MIQIALTEGRQEVILVKDGVPLREVRLAPKEWDLLMVLTKSPKGNTMSRTDIAKTLWKGRNRPKDARTVDQHVARLRYKLRPALVILTVPTRGYKIAYLGVA